MSEATINFPLLARKLRAAGLTIGEITRLVNSVMAEGSWDLNPRQVSAAQVRMWLVA